MGGPYVLVQIVKPEVRLSGLSKRIAERDRFFAAGHVLSRAAGAGHYVLPQGRLYSSLFESDVQFGKERQMVGRHQRFARAGTG
jgi:hypothetical protein